MSDVPSTATVWRLPVPPPSFDPDRSWRPDHEQFVPSSADRADAGDAHPVRVSVWDRTRTTPEQMWRFRSKRCLVLAVAVSLLLERATEWRPECRVVYDELPEPKRTWPGADGHAGIEGLERRSGEPKLAYKDSLRQLADTFRWEGFLDGGEVLPRPAITE